MPMSRFSGGMNTLSEETTRSSKSTLPLVGFSNPAMMRSMVVLPQPDGPSRVMNSPSANTASKFSSTVVLPKVLVTF